MAKGKSKKSDTKKKINVNEENLKKGIQIAEDHLLFGHLNGDCIICNKNDFGTKYAAAVNRDKQIYLNKDVYMPPKQWAYIIAHCRLHLAFGHFDADHLPGYNKLNPDGTSTHIPSFNKAIWNEACNIYIAKFLSDVKFGEPVCGNPADELPISLTDEDKIYDYLMEINASEENQTYGVASSSAMDMIGLERPITYTENQENMDIKQFAHALAWSASSTVSKAGGHEILKFKEKPSPALEAAHWFINHYPLLGALAASFTIVEDVFLCRKYDIQIAAIDVTTAEIFVNPTANLNFEELKFTMAHEFLHAGLVHHERRQGRDHYLWNIACDYVINGWLHDMKIGAKPELGLLYDKTLQGMSAESIYDIIVRDLKKFSKLNTFRGYGLGDIMDSGKKKTDLPGKNFKNGMSLDDFYKSALAQGLAFHQSSDRGYIPAGLIEEIRALAMPPIPWDVELARWFDCFFPPIERYRSYARPSRRQASTPDIPRPNYTSRDLLEDGRTFGVVLDTSGSMSAKMIGMALGSIASYAASKEVPYARVVFCDADAYDAGYLAPEDIAGRVAVKGRGGTILQPGVNLLEKAKDFPKNGPILIITDGGIEDSMNIQYPHAFLLPRGSYLPFKAKGDLIYFSEK